MEVSNLLKEAKTYEEAKQIIKDSTKGELNQKYMNLLKLKSGLVTGIGTGVAVAIGALTNNYEILVGLVPGAVVLGFSYLIPLMARKKEINNIQNEKFFEGKTEYDVMKMANTYVKKFNEYKSQKHERNY